MDGAGNLYGTTASGGASGQGTVFELSTREPENVVAAPTLTTTAGNTVVLGSGDKLTDSATLAGGITPTGTITFTLTGPGGNVVDTEMTPVNGNGTYPTPNGFVPTALGTYLWSANYSGDSNNNPVSAPGLATTSFAGGNNGEFPDAGVILDSTGDLYGTTEEGGTSGDGTIFELAKGSSTITVLASFDGTDGTFPGGALVMDAAGNLYGTASLGGAFSDGTIFELAKGSSTITVLASFNGTDGLAPSGALVMDAAGNLYGATQKGGASNVGTVFELAKGSGTITALASISGTSGGIGAVGGLVMDSAGNLYGTTLDEGTDDEGSIFELPKGSSTITVLASFTLSNGIIPNAGLILDSAGNLYGAAADGGASGFGTIFELAKGSSTITALASFDGTDGETPLGGLVMDGAGNLYGMASYAGGAANDGDIYELPKGSGVITVLVSFDGSNGAGPEAGLVMDGAGNLYGTTSAGGASDAGTVFGLDSRELEMVIPTAVTPTLTTTPGGSIVIGSGGELTDSATLSAGLSPTGTMTFTLYAPNGTTVVDTQTDVVNGNGTYTTPSGYLPAAAGTYQWVVSYSGDGNDTPVSSPEGSEPELVSPATPTLSTTPGGTLVIGSGSKLTDSAAISAGFNPTGFITFTLYGPNGTTVVDTETTPVSGDNTYNTPTGFVPTAVGTYQWVVSYSGDNNNTPLSSPKGTEPESVTLATPTLSTTPGGTVAVGSGVDMTDSATLSGGDNPTGTITFTLYAPNGTTVVDTEADVISGDGTYDTSNGYLPTAAGTYQWVASYSGNNNNNPVAGTKGAEPEVAAPPNVPPTITAPASVTVNPGVAFDLGYVISVTDTANGGNDNQTLTLSAGDGNLSFGTMTGLVVTGNDSGSVTASGTLANLDADLPTLSYTANAGATSDTLSLSDKDTSDSLTSATKTIPITVNQIPAIAGPTAVPANTLQLFRNTADATSGASTTGAGDTSVASVGNVVFMTGNSFQAVSSDHGNSFSSVPIPANFSAYSNQWGAFDGSQRLAQAPSQNMVLWYLEYGANGSSLTSTNGVILAAAVGASAVAGNTWTPYEFTPASFGYGTGFMLESPQMQTSRDFVYMTSNVVSLTTGQLVGAVMWRVSLSQLAASGGITFNYWTFSASSQGGANLALVNGAQGTMYAASNYSPTTGVLSTGLVVYSQTELSTSITTSTVSGLEATAVGPETSLAPDGSNWLADVNQNVESGWISGTTVGFLWNSGAETSRPSPFVRAVELNTSTMVVESQPDIWSNVGTAYADAAISIDATGGLGGTLLEGSSTEYPSLDLLIADNVTGPPPTWSLTQVATGNADDAAAFGGYLGATPDSVFTNTFLIAGEVDQNGSVVPNLTWFGRHANAPIDLSGDLLSPSDVTAQPGQSVTLTFGVQNTEAGDADDPLVEFFLTRNSTVTPSDFLLGSTNLPIVDGFSQALGSITLTLPAASASVWQGGAPYTIGMIVNPPGLVAGVEEPSLLPEANLANNSNQGIGLDLTNVVPIPVVQVPGPTMVAENTSVTFSSANQNGITLQDPAATGPDTLSLSVGNGILTLGSIAGLTFLNGTANKTSSIMVKGTLASLQAAVNGLIYTPDLNSGASDLLSISLADTDPALFGSASIAITVYNWQGTSNPVPNFDSAGVTLLLPNGDLMVHGGPDQASAAWYLVTPDSKGNYVDGTWAQMPSMNVGRLFFESDVLPNGDIFVAGGEYTLVNGGTVPTETNTAEMYVPGPGQNYLTGKWNVLPNNPQPLEGDVPSEVLPGGNVLVGDIEDPGTEIFDPTTDTWSAGGTKIRSDEDSNEEPWAKLPNGDILAYDLYASIDAGRGLAEIYNPSTNTWSDASSGTLPVLSSENTGFELGPELLLPNGLVFLGGTNGKTALYNYQTNSWTQGPTLPNVPGVGQMTMTDDPGAVMPDGDLLLSLSPPEIEDNFPGPTLLFDFNPNTGIYTSVTPNLAGLDLSGSDFADGMLVLPTGQVLLTNMENGPATYGPLGTVNAAWRPTITSFTSTGGGSFTLTGTQLNGLDEGAAYGDDNQMAENYPIVQVTDAVSGNVYYATTSNWSSVGVATGSTPETVNVVLPALLGNDPYSLVVIANGIASSPMAENGANVPAITAPSSIPVAGTSSYDFRGTISISDPGATGADSLSLSVTDGTLTFPSTVGLTFIDGTSNGSSSITATGTVAALNLALSELTYVPNAGFNGSDSLQIALNSSANNLSAFANVSLTVIPGPAITVPPQQYVLENGFLNFGNALGLSDSSASGTSDTLSLTINNGTLTLGSTAGLTFDSGTTNDSASIMVTGTLANLNAALDGLVYTPTPNQTAADVLSITLFDGADSPTTASRSVDITVVPLAPVVTAPSQVTVVPNNKLTFSLGELTVSDSSATATSDTLTLEVNDGTLTLGATGGSSSQNGATTTVTGTLAELNAALDGLVYTPTASFTGTDTLSITDANSVDNLSGTATITISVVQPPPVVTAPMTASVNENGLLAFTGGNAIGVADLGPGTEQLTLSVDRGALTLGTTTGLTVTGNDSDSVVVTGSRANLNADLPSLTYVPVSQTYGSDTLTISDTDRVDNLTGRATVTITIVGLPPHIAAPPSVAVPNGPFAFTGANSISVTDPAGSSGTVEQLLLLAQYGTLNLTTTTGLTTVIGLNSGSVELIGPTSNLNTDLASLTYTPGSGYPGNDAIVLSDTDTLDDLTYTTAVTVGNAPPSVSAPAKINANEDASLTFSSANNNAITLSDSWATAASETLSLQVTNGTLNLASTQGLTILNGSNSTSIAVSGTLAALNTALNGLVYTPNSNFTGPDSLTIGLSNLIDNLAGSATVLITVIAPPVASAGPNQTVTAGTVVPLNGTVTNTNTSGGTLTTLWQVANGPGSVSFANSASPQTTATFSVPGTYYLRLLATYGGASDQSYVTFTVDAVVPPSTVTLQQGTNNYSGMTDSYINNAKNDATVNYVTSTTLTAAGPQKSEEDALLLWNLTSVAGTIQSASITLDVTTGSTSTYNLYALARSWNPSQVTFDQAANGQNWQVAGANGSADYKSTVLGTLYSTGTGFATITLNTAGIAQLQSWVSNPSSNYGFIIKDPLSTDKLTINFDSSKAATVADRPTLTINLAATVVPPPASPVTNPVTSATAAVNGTSGTPDTGYMEAVGINLATLYFQYVQWQQSGSSSPFSPNPTQAGMSAADISGTSVEVVVTTEPTLTSQVQTALTGLGMQSLTASGDQITGLIPISQLANLAMLHGVVSAAPTSVPPVGGNVAPSASPSSNSASQSSNSTPVTQNVVATQPATSNSSDNDAAFAEVATGADWTTEM
jgi:uncharacterized repeat protein (TIGR03803 family)